MTVERGASEGQWLTWLERISADGPTSVDTARLVRRLGRLSPSAMSRVAPRWLPTASTDPVEILPVHWHSFVQIIETVDLDIDTLRAEFTG